MKVSIGKKGATRLAALFGFALAACVGLLGSGGLAQAGIPANSSLANNPLNKVEQLVLDDTANGQTTSFVVLMSEQADVSKAYTMRDQDARGWYVYDALKATADSGQTAIKADLDKQHIAYKSFWVANMLVVNGDRSVVTSIASRADVRRIESNDSFYGLGDPVDITNSPVTYDDPHTVEWGVANVNAPQVWAMGFTGQGIVISNQDTGMRWTHNAIKAHYRGWNGTTADHNYNWWDSIHSGGGSCGANNQAPCDDHSHGTHTTGTTNGDDGAGNQIGVAPGARWIGCRNMDQGNGTPATYTECFQFFIAPTDLNGQNPNPTLRPHVMNNSWGCPASEGCAALTLQTIVENTQAAGIFVEASAGNGGSACSTVSDPPALYAAAFSTGAIDSSNSLASFSSRGPVTADGSNRLKPNVSAPGVNNRSSVNSSDTAYSSFSGTSMAGPHVVGVVALLWSAHPELSRMITETKNLLQNTANPQVNAGSQVCGGTPPSQIPNNEFGYGRVDALAAVNAAGGGTPTPGPTNTTVPPTITPVLTDTPVPTNTSVPPTGSPPPSNTPEASPTPCALSFSDVHLTDYFYTAVMYLACHGVISGYGDGTFRPFNNTTRGQLTKIIVLAEGWTLDCPTPGHFTDVPPDSTFFCYVETAVGHGIISGYADGTFKPGNNVTRGQLCKIVVLAEGWTDACPQTGHFNDVLPSNPFFCYIETAFTHGVISGYSDGTFRSGNPATRGQISKIVYQAIGAP